MALYYQINAVLSLVLSLVFLLKWNRSVSIHYALFFVIIPLINFGYLRISVASGINEALIANGLTYLTGCFLELFFLLYLVSFCKFRLPKPLTGALFLLSSFIFCVALNASGSDLLYTAVSFKNLDGATYLEKEYGLIHSVYLVMVAGYLLANLGILIYGFIKKDVSKKHSVLLFVTYFITFIAFEVGNNIHPALQLIPTSLIITQITFLIIINRITLYDVTGTAASTITAKGDIGFVSFDLKRHYLGCTPPALECFPELNDLFVDERLKYGKKNYIIIHSCLDGVDEDNQEYSSVYIDNDDRDFKVTAGYMYSDKKITGYQLRIEDNTREKQYIDLLTNYKSDLEKDVNEKTEHIREIMDKFVMGMAEMVQNRDNNTGGHIKRTSSVVRILTDEMKKDSSLTLTDEFYEHIIKAAPMHDLGKIAVDDAILRKPGRFTPEEYEIMKTHAAKGAEIVENILAGVEEPDFVELAINVAHYHHERFDGSGYPTGISGEDIPIEARIMAIADVYDALVSKRCYKDEFSFEKAYSIIEEGMGTQFDPKLNDYFVRCRERIEAYYKEVKTQ